MAEFPYEGVYVHTSRRYDEVGVTKSSLVEGAENFVSTGLLEV